MRHHGGLIVFRKMRTRIRSRFGSTRFGVNNTLWGRFGVRGRWGLALGQGLTFASTGSRFGVGQRFGVKA